MNQGIHLTLLMGIGVPLPVPKPVIEALESVEVRHNTDSPSGFSLTFRFTNQSVLGTLLTLMATQGPFVRTIIIVTHNGIPHVLMDGLIDNQQISPGLQSGGSLTLMGTDLSSAMDLVEIKGLPFPGMPPSARVAAILAKYAAFGVIPLVIPSLFPDLPIPTERIPTQGGTDKFYIELLAGEVGHVFYVDPGPAPGTSTAYWGPEIILEPAHPCRPFQ